jgi:hypothetical protein
MATIQASFVNAVEFFNSLLAPRGAEAVGEGLDQAVEFAGGFSCASAMPPATRVQGVSPHLNSQPEGV